jgi:hypothetical protein
MTEVHAISEVLVFVVCGPCSWCRAGGFPTDVACAVDDGGRKGAHNDVDNHGD